MQTILTNTRRPDITFYATGQIDISANVVNTLGLSTESHLNIAVDNGEFYLFADRCDTHARHAARCYRAHKGSGVLRANSARLARAILESVGASERVSLPCGSALTISGRLFLPIITRRPLRIDNKPSIIQ